MTGRIIWRTCSLSPYNVFAISVVLLPATTICNETWRKYSHSSPSRRLQQESRRRKEIWELVERDVLATR